MRPFVVNGDIWRVIRVRPGDLRLVDRTGTRTVATADPVTKTIHVSTDLNPPELDVVMLHEVAHAVTMSHGLLRHIRSRIPEEYWVPVEEWAAQLVGEHGVEAVAAASSALGRPVCVRGLCQGVSERMF